MSAPAAYRVRDVAAEDHEAVLALVRRVFSAFNAAQYGDRPDRFLDQVTDVVLGDLAKQGATLVACSADGEIVGVIALNVGEHLEWLFVEAAHHRRGIARLLWDALLERRPDAQRITVNASDHGAPWYEAIGFAHERGHVSRSTGAEVRRMVWRRSRG